MPFTSRTVLIRQRRACSHSTRRCRVSPLARHVGVLHGVGAGPGKFPAHANIPTCHQPLVRNVGLSIHELLILGKRIDMPPRTRGMNVTFKRAPKGRRDTGAVQPSLLDGTAGEG